MADAAVTDKPDGDGAVLQNGLVAALDDTSDKFLSRFLLNLVLRLVAGAASALNLTEQLLVGGAVLDESLHRHHADSGFVFTHSSPPVSTSNWPA